MRAAKLSNESPEATIQECRRHASECKRLAEQSNDLAIKAEYLHLALRWEEEAEARELDLPPAYVQQPPANHLH